MKKCFFLLATLVVCATASAAWEYEPIADKMSGKTGVRADVTSDNKLSFDFPYQGQNRGFLTVRQHPQYGLGVIVSIDKGQMLCNVYDCKVSVKFDDAKPLIYSGSGPSDGGFNPEVQPLDCATVTGA